MKRAATVNCAKVPLIPMTCLIYGNGIMQSFRVLLRYLSAGEDGRQVEISG